MYSSPLGGGFSSGAAASPMDRFGHQQEQEMNKQQQPPSFLFGTANKRRSLALGSTANPYLHASAAPAPSTDIFASPLPSHMKEGSKNVHWSPSLIQEKSMGGASTVATGAKPLPFSPSSKGPPLRSLREEVEPVRKAPRRQSIATPMSTASPRIQQPQQHPVGGLLDTSAATPNPDAECWVTIFGFGPNDASRVLKFFSRHGEIVQQQAPPRGGNFIHARYSCAVHARQALARNGHIIDGQVMVGVVPCIEKDVVGEAALARASLSRSLVSEAVREDVGEEESMDEGGIHESVPQCALDNTTLDNSMNASRLSMASRSGMRSLAKPYDTGARAADPNAQKENSFMGKLWSYVAPQ